MRSLSYSPRVSRSQHQPPPSPYRTLLLCLRSISTTNEAVRHCHHALRALLGPEDVRDRDVLIGSTLRKPEALARVPKTSILPSDQATVQRPENQSNQPVPRPFAASRIALSGIDPCNLPTALLAVLCSSPFTVFLARIDFNTRLKSPSCFPK